MTHDPPEQVDQPKEKKLRFGKERVWSARHKMMVDKEFAVRSGEWHEAEG